MSILFESIEIVASFIEFFILYKIYNILFHEQRRNGNVKVDIILAMLGTGIIEICNHISLFSYYAMLIFVIYVSITVIILYRTKYIFLFSIASFYLLCLSCFDFLVFTLVSNFYGGYETFVKLVSAKCILRMIIVFSIKFLWVLAYLLLKKFLYSISLKKNYMYTILVASCMGFLGFLFLVNQTFKAFNYTMTEVWAAFLVFFALIIFATYYAQESKEEKMKLNYAKMANQLLENNYKTINDIYMSNAKLYHDLNNHLNVLFQLLDKGNLEDAKKYIKEISKPILKLSQITWTGVDVVDVTINSKIEKMKEKKIAYEINVEFPQNTNIKPHDMCTILANLLDNAIEATGSLEHAGNITLTIRRINHFLLIKIANSCAEREKNFVDYPATTKENKEQHGWGFPSVMDAVERYNGTLKWINRGNQFVVQIVLFYEILEQSM